jgi:hypothetical protein
MAGTNAISLVIAGEHTQIRLKAAGLVAAERKWGADWPPIEGSLYAAWVTLGMPGGPKGFDGWLATVDEMIPPTSENGEDPTSATSPEASLPSPPSPA